MNTAKPIPPNWGGDSLSDYLNHAENHCHAGFVRLKAEYEHLAKIDGLFMRAMEHLNNTPNWFPLFFFGRAFSSFRVSARLALSGSMTETYTTLRSAIEFSLYAVHIDSIPNLQEPWIKREDSAEHKKLVRKEFQHIKVMESAAKRLPKKIYEAIDKLYDRSIDQGAHPNVHGVLLGSQFARDKVVSIFLQNDENRIKAVIKDTCRVGVVSLRCFQEIYSTRFELIGLDAEFDEVSQGL